MKTTRGAAADSTTRCVACGAAVPGFDIVRYGSIEGGYRELCTHCFNAEVALQSGLDEFENLRFERMVMKDAVGVPHEFHFRTRLLGTMVSVEALELINGEPGGYDFQIVGDPEEDLFAICGRLVERMRRALSIRHLTDDESGPQIADSTVRARISADMDSDSRAPSLVIDGRTVTWEQFGRMLMTFEGWQFRMEIVDRSDEP